jgi:predicted phage terminase large subunit-like protein
MEYPLLDNYGRCLWPQKFKTSADIQKLRNTIGSETAWQREYLLKIIPEDDAIILRDWISYYDSLPAYRGEFRFIAIAVDLAISLGSRSDYTAIVITSIFGYDSELKIYIHAYPVNKRLSFPDTIEEIKGLYKSLGAGITKRIFIEDVAYQGAVAQELVRQGYPAEGVKVMGSDKRQRLIVTTHLIKSAKILFARKGCEDLITELTGFGYEAHDDLADAFAILIQKVVEESIYPPILIGRA